MKEEWKPVVGYEGYYKVSASGAVRSIPRKGTKGGLLKRKIGPDKYTRVSLYKKGVIRYLPVSGLVLEAFVGPRPKNMEAAHNDGNPQYNHVSNLRWATHQENLDDRKSHGTDPVGERNPNCKLTCDEVASIRSLADSHRAIAAQYGISKSQVTRIRSGAQWK